MSRKSFIHKPKTKDEFRQLHNTLTSRGYVAIDALRPGRVRDISLAMADVANAGAQDMATKMDCGAWSNGPLSKVAWSFDSHNESVVPVKGPDGGNLGLGYVKWGAANNIPSTIPPLAMSSPYTAAPLRYIADLTSGLGVKLMYRLSSDKLVEFKFAGEFLKDDTAAYQRWHDTWEGSDYKDPLTDLVDHTPGAREFLENNDLDLHLLQCEQDDVMLDIYFPTVGLQRGRRGKWDPKIVQVGVFEAHSTRLERMNEFRHINHVYHSDSWRTLGAGGTNSILPTDSSIRMYPCVMPQHRLSDLRYIVESNQRTRIKDRPTWIVCPTYYPSGNKAYYPQPAWWSVFTSKAFDFAATILYDKYKARDNSITWGRIIYISLDWLDQVFADEGYQGNFEKQQKYIDELDDSVENFLQHRDNHGKTMRQWMWEGKDGKQHKNVEIVDVTETKSDTIKAGKEELELSTSPIFLALQVDPRLVGVPMVAASNGGTALREMHLLKQQQLNPKQRLYLQFMNTIARFNKWDDHAEFHIVQQTLTTLDNSKTGTKETIAGEGA